MYLFLVTPHFFHRHLEAMPIYSTIEHNFQRAGHIDEAPPYQPGPSLSARDVQAREAVFEVSLLCLGLLSGEELAFAGGIASSYCYDTIDSPQPPRLSLSLSLTGY